MSDGVLYVAGIGPGRETEMTLAVREALETCDLIVGYTVDVDLIRQLFPGKEVYTTPMRQETSRCRAALAAAGAGRTVCLVCSGDAGVYGMAGLVFQLSGEYPGVEIRVLPGVTAALSGGALLGAPLTHDFCVISLSDRLTAWEVIEKRLEAAAEADFCMVLYNPASKSRPDYLEKACRILLKRLSGDTVCGIAGRIGREGEYTRILPLKELAGTQVDMFATVFIGNSSTMKLGSRMVTPRGYRDLS